MHDLVQPQRVLYVQHTADMYGASQALLHLLAGLDRRQVTPLVVLPQNGPMVAALHKVEIEPLFDRHMRVLWGKTLRSWRALPFALTLLPASLTMRAIIRQQRIDIVHSNTWTNLSGALAVAGTTTPHVWHIREVLLNMRGLKPVLARFTLRSAQHLICISQAVAAQFEAIPGPAARHVIYDGLPLSSQVPATTTLRRAFDLPAHSQLIGVVGRLHPQKGQTDLLRAFALLPPDLRARSHCVVIGDAAPGEAMRAQLAALAQELDINRQVHFTGYRPDARTLIAELDILVLPATRDEGLGGVLLEAMDASVPVIASAVGGTVEVVKNGVTGLLVPPRDPQALAAAIQQLLNDATMRHHMGAAGRLTVEQKFTVETSANQVQQIYRSIQHK